MSGASPSEEAVARLLCSDCGNDPDWLVGNHEPPPIATPMGHQEYKATPLMEEMKRESPIPRLGTPTDIAEAVAWLAGPDAGFVTGTDLLVDGGVVASLRGWPSPA